LDGHSEGRLRNLLGHLQYGLLMTLFTPEDLVMYLYNETSPEKTAAIELALQNDWALREKLQLLRESVTDVERMPLSSPRTEVILRVLNYAKQTEPASV